MSRLTRDDIVIAAGKRFATYGYHGTSMRDLGDDLGIRGSSIYSHVGGKQELLVAVVERASDLFSASAEAALAAETDPSETLRVLISGHVDVLVDHSCEARTFLAEVDFMEDSDRRRITEVRNAYEMAFRTTIQKGIADGTFRFDVDATLAGIYVLSMLNAMQRWYTAGGRLSRTELAEDMYQFAVHGLT